MGEKLLFVLITVVGAAALPHKLPESALEVNCKLPPAQIVVGPFAEMVGAAGIGLAETTTVLDTLEVQPFVTCLTE